MQSQLTIWKFREPSLTALLSTAHLALRHDVGEHLGQLRQRVARPRHGSRLHHPHLHRGIESLCLVTEMALLFLCRLVSYLHIRHQTVSGVGVDLNPSKVCRSSRLSSHQSPLISTHSLSWEPRGVVIMIHCGTLPTHSISDHNISSETNPSRIIADRDKKINTRIIKYLLEVCCAIF